MNALSDLQIHIEQIRKKLWCGREFGQAAVMVGSGFCRNAARLFPNTPKFPLWNSLAEIIYRELYPDLSNTKNYANEKLKRMSGGGVLKLAYEYDITFGRMALDNLVIQSIPDEQYVPGNLHKLLLSLPWSDVFTTNYDTLLERTRISIHDRKYDLILTIKDIPGRMRPRIVKLHGSLPSHRPFILTEEDYRNYPQQFAPFVNMIQQSIMENVLCLIGFSGDDPNFLYWTGWVRDNLGSSTPPIYLCGVLNLSSSQRKVLESKKIIPIDLGLLFTKDEWPDSEIQHKKAIEWFLLNLLYGNPPSKLRWPSLNVSKAWKPSKGIPSIPQGPSIKYLEEKIHPSNWEHTLEEKELKKLLETWNCNRLNYPDWIIAPNETRERIWTYTEEWIEPIISSIDKLNSPDNLFLLHELNWRLEKSLTPLLLPWVDCFIKIIKQFNPFPTILDIPEASIIPTNMQYHELNWKEIIDSWINLSFAIVRESREDLDEKRFYFWIERLAKIVERNPEWNARWYYEQVLFSLYQFDNNKVKALLEKWPVMDDFPIWEARRAKVLAEIGELKRALEISEKALNIVRNRIQPYQEDFSLLSQEGWIMNLLKSLKSCVRNGYDKEEEMFYKDRWEKLNSYKCNPLPEINLLEALLEDRTPEKKPEREIKGGFDPGRITISFHFGNQFSFKDFRPGFSYLRLIEEGALLIRSRNNTFNSKTLINAAKNIAPFAPLWSFVTLFRVHADKELKEKFDRVQIASMKIEEVNNFYRLIYPAISKRLDEIKEKQAIDKLLSLLCEIASRLCFRLKTEQIVELYELSIDMHTLLIFQQIYILNDSLKSLFKRVFYAMPQDEILKKIPELLSLPFPNENKHQHFDYVEPMEEIEWYKNYKLDPSFDRTSWSEPINILIDNIKNGNQDIRIMSFQRLAKIFNINGINDDEKIKFAEALWSRINPNTGLPSDSSDCSCNYLLLPEIEKGKAKERFIKLILSSDFGRIIHNEITPDGKNHVAISSKQDDYIFELIYGTVNPIGKDQIVKLKLVDWTSEQSYILLEKIIGLWEDEKIIFKSRKRTSFFNTDYELKRHFEELLWLMAEVILPRLKETSKQDLATCMLKEMMESGVNVLPALPITLFFNKTVFEVDMVAKLIQKNLYSNDYWEVKEALIAIVKWHTNYKLNRIPAPPKYLLDSLVNCIVLRRQPGLEFAIEQLTLIIERMYDLLNEEQIQSLLIALEYLLNETDFNNVNNDTFEKSINEYPDLRKESVKLAHYLYLLFNQLNKEIPLILEKWKHIGETDPLPEVRRAWNEVVEL